MTKDMKRDINEFVQFKIQPGGFVKFSRSISQERNLYELLKDLGFRKCKINKKIVYFQWQDNGLKKVNISIIKDAFKDFIKQENFINLPKEVSSEYISEWYYGSKPIKVNGLFDSVLYQELSEFQIETYFEQE